MNELVRRRILSVTCILGFFVVWELLCLAFHVSDIVLPRPSQILITLWTRFPAIWPHAVQTLYTTLVGFGLGIIIGILLGMLIGSSRLAYDVAYPMLVGFSSIPKVAVVPIFVLWFGAGTVPAILTAMIMCVFPIVVNVATGLATTRLAMKPMASTVPISAAAHPKAVSRAARRPVASKKTGFLLVICRCHAWDRDSGAQLYAKPPAA